MKRKNIKKIASLFLAFSVVLGSSMSVYASDVTVENDKIVIHSQGVYTTSDMFGGLKNIMPGDTRSQSVILENKTGDADSIRVYLRAEAHDKESNPVSAQVVSSIEEDERRGETDAIDYMNDFLAQLTLKVDNGQEEIYAASPDKEASLAENVLIATLKKDETAELNVELDVPIELSNKYMDRVGEVDWVFTVEGLDAPTPVPTGVLEITKEPTPSPEPTAEPTVVPSEEPTATPVPSEEPTATPVPSGVLDITQEPTITPDNGNDNPPSNPGNNGGGGNPQTPPDNRSTSTKSPKTGDESQTAFYFSILLASVAVTMITIKKRIKR